MKNEQQKGGWTMCAPGDNQPSISVFLLVTTLLFLRHTTDGSIECRLTEISPRKNIMDAVDDIQVNTVPREWCFLMYTIDGVFYDRRKFKLHTYVAGGIDRASNNDFGIDVCGKRTKPGCEIKTTAIGQYWRQDVACCCNSDFILGATFTVPCNDARYNNSMNPTPYFENLLNTTQQQRCRIDYGLGNRIANCTRLTKQNESATTPSRCRSLLTNSGTKEELDCAHHPDNGVDRCKWAYKLPVTSGVCHREYNDDVECCCNGAYCNGADYMNLTCRAAIAGDGDDFTYGTGNCAVARPPPTTTSETTPNGPIDPDSENNKNAAGKDAATTPACYLLFFVSLWATHNLYSEQRRVGNHRGVALVERSS